MKLECIKEKITQAVHRAGRIAARSLTLPVLEAVLLIAHGNTLKVRATNLEIGVEIDIPAKVSKEGVVAVPAHVLGNLLANTTTPTVTIESEGKNITITTAYSGTHINGYPYEDFPTLPKPPECPVVVCHADKFAGGLRSVWYSAALSDIKPEIASIFVYSEHGVLVFVATDSFRLAEKKIAVSGVDDTHIPSLLIPIKNAGEILKILDGLSGALALRFSKNQIVLSMDGVYITSRLVDGVFPDYKQIIPKEHTTEIVVLKQDFANALKMMNTFSDEFNQVDIMIDPKQKLFSIHSKNAHVGEHTARLEATISGTTASLSFSHRYLSECLASIPGDSISIKIVGENKPLIMRGVGDKTFMYLVMPLNK